MERTSFPQSCSSSHEHSTKHTFEDEVPKYRYSLQKNKDESKFAGIIVIEKDDSGLAREFPFRKYRENEKWTLFHCPYCNKTFLEYNKDEDKLYWIDNEKNHIDGYECAPVPLAVLEEKYNRLRNGVAVSHGWWKKQGIRYNFKPPLRYAAAHKIIQSKNLLKNEYPV